MDRAFLAKVTTDGNGQFQGEVYLVRDAGEELTVLFVPAEYDYSHEQFEHAAGSTLRADETADDWGQVRHPVLVTMRDKDQRDIPQKLKLVGGEDE